MSTLLKGGCLLGCVVGAYGHYNSHFSEIVSGDHKALVSPKDSSAARWLIFPEQKEMHLSGAVSARHSDRTIVDPDNFWKVHGESLGLSEHTHMVLQREWSIGNTKITHRKYEQYVHNVRVFGGDYVLTIGSHGGVTNVHGLTLSHSDLASNHNLDTKNFIDHKVAFETMESHIINQYNMKSGAMKLNKPMETVWLTPSVSNGKEGMLSMVYYVSGMIRGERNAVDETDIDSVIANRMGVSDGEDMLVLFDGFIDVKSGEVVMVLDKSGQFQRQNSLTKHMPTAHKTNDVGLTSTVDPTSPFGYPIPQALFVYDQYLKDFNDDKEDDYYSQDPDRYSEYTLVFDTTAANYTYPTSDVEMNMLVDTTLYTDNLYYSLSGGSYYTWNITSTTDLNIEYNLTIANAYFDGSWGIHFGTGFITDDVVAHEWSHGYTQSANGLIYAYQSGAMNEAMSDIFGESVDILNMDTVDPDKLRSATWPAECHVNVPGSLELGVPSGTDTGTRWSMGENVTYFTTEDGSLRDMYKPECFLEPTTTLAPYYVCSNLAGDNGGVHLNSGVLNRLYATIVDGGKYPSPTSTDYYDSSQTVTVTGLGFTKALNLFWRTQQELTESSQFLDLATALSNVCEMNIGVELYEPNVMSQDYEVSTEVLTASDCNNVEIALTGAGMYSTENFCPNFECTDIYNCKWVQCPDSTHEIFYEDYSAAMSGTILNPSYFDAACNPATSYARVFDQSSFDLNMSVSCIEFGFKMLGQEDITLNVYIDSTGGDPDEASLRLVHSFAVTPANSYSYISMTTVSSDTPFNLDFNNDAETLVIVMDVPEFSEGYMFGGGRTNSKVVNTIGETYISSDCTDGFVSYNDYLKTVGKSSTTQWYVRVLGNGKYYPGPDPEPVTSSPTMMPTSPTDADTNSNGSDKSSLSAGAVAGISITVIVVVFVAIGGGIYWYKSKSNKDGQISEPLRGQKSVDLNKA